ncbi:hypothetical protein BH10CYA1_BH10CYA1_19150 [soil metagenome]
MHTSGVYAAKLTDSASFPIYPENFKLVSQRLRR